MEGDLGELVYVDKEGWKQAEEWRKRKYRWSGKIAPAAFIIITLPMIAMKILAYTTSIMPEGWQGFGIISVTILFGLAMAVIGRLGKKELRKKYKPVKVYENGITFTEWYMSHGVIDKVNYMTVKFDEIEKVEINVNTNFLIHSKNKREEPIKMIIGDKEEKEHVRFLQKEFYSDEDKLLEIFEEKGIPVEPR